MKNKVWMYSLGCESYSVAWISFAARSSDPTNFTLEEEDRTLGGSSKLTLGIFSLLCSNKPSVHLYHCVLGHHQLPENSRRRQLGLFNVKFWSWSSNVHCSRRPTFLPWDPISPCGPKDDNSHVSVHT